jgi:hypothetical protein
MAQATNASCPTPNHRHLRKWAFRHGTILACVPPSACCSQPCWRRHALTLPVLQVWSNQAFRMVARRRARLMLQRQTREPEGAVEEEGRARSLRMAAAVWVVATVWAAVPVPPMRLTRRMRRLFRPTVRLTSRCLQARFPRLCSPTAWSVPAPRSAPPSSVSMVSVATASAAAVVKPAISAG